jgi:hypothetical protein
VVVLLAAAAAGSTASVAGQIRYPYPGPYRGPYPYGPYRYDAELKLQVSPKEAEVYVDGYFAGVVDEFDGAFQRLHVVPGQHEIVVYLEGYRSIREKLYLGPNSSRKLERTMEKLAAGEPNEPKPEPVNPPEPPRDPRNDPGGRTPRDPRRPI